MSDQDHPNDNGNGAIQLPYKWRDEEGTLDLSDPTDLERAKRLINQGYGYEKGQQELKTVKGEAEEYRNQVEYWNGLIEEANSTGDISKVKSALEMAGVKLEKSDDGDLNIEPDDAKFKELTKKVDDLQSALYNKYTGDIHTQLEAKYNKDSGLPEYNKKEVENFADKKGIRDFEDAYYILHKDAILESKEKQKIDKAKDHKNKINKVASDPGGGGNLPPKPVDREGNYGKVTAKWLNDPTVTENLFLDE